MESAEDDKNYRLIEHCCRYCSHFCSGYECMNTCDLDDRSVDCYGVCDKWEDEWL